MFVVFIKQFCIIALIMKNLHIILSSWLTLDESNLPLLIISSKVEHWSDYQELAQIVFIIMAYSENLPLRLFPPMVGFN
jgi:hypothetical protein